MPLPAQQGARAVGSLRFGSLGEHGANLESDNFTEDGALVKHAARYDTFGPHATSQSEVMSLASPRSSTRNASPACKSALLALARSVFLILFALLCAQHHASLSKSEAAAWGLPVHGSRRHGRAPRQAALRLDAHPRAHSYQPRSERTGHANQQCDRHAGVTEHFGGRAAARV